MRGNVLDLAVGVIIGAAFQAIVTSLTSDIISPILGIFGGVNFDQFQVTINGATIMYGKFITAVINFLIMAFVIFLIVKLVNKVMSLGKKLNPKKLPQQKSVRSVSVILISKPQNVPIAQAISSTLQKKQTTKIISLLHKQILHNLTTNKKATVES